MINPIKRGGIILGVCALLLLATLFIPAVKNSGHANFLMGGAAGGATIAVLMIVVALVQRQKA